VSLLLSALDQPQFLLQLTERDVVPNRERRHDHQQHKNDQHGKTPLGAARTAPEDDRA